MATRKPGSKSKSKPKAKLKAKSVKAKAPKAAPAKKAANMPAPPASPTAMDVSAAVAAPTKQKVKLVRDSFAMPKNEYQTLSDLKLRSIRLRLPAKKSEILRAGVAVLSKMSDTEFAAALNTIPSLKTGRPKDSKKSDAKKSAKKP
jgi:hypothetical protein